MSDTDNKNTTQPHTADTAFQPEGMELREIVALLWNGKWWIAGFVAAGLVLSLAYAFVATPVYRADAMLQIQQQNSSLPTLGGHSDILSSLFGANSQAQAEIQIMTSRAVVDPVIRKLNLNITVKSAPYGAVEVSRLEVPSAWYDEELTIRATGGGGYTLYDPNDGKVLTGQVGHTAFAASGRVVIEVSRLDLAKGKEATLVRQPVQREYREVYKHLSATELGHDTGIVQISLLGTNPVHVRNVLNALVNQYLDQNVSAYSAQARRSLMFVNKQLPDLKQEMNKAEDKLTNYQVSHNTVNIDEQAKAFLQEFNTLEGELTRLQLAEAALGQQYTSKYPAYAAMEQQKANVRKRIKTLEDRLDNLPKDEQGYVQLKRDAEVYTKLYTALLGKEQDLRVAAAGTVGSARVVDDAVTPIKPVKPNKRLVVILGFMLGLGLGVGALLLRRALSAGMSDAVEIEQRFGVPMYAVVPHSRLEEKYKKRRKGGAGSTSSLLALDAGQDSTVEALRSLRTSLDFALRNVENHIVGLTGPAPGIGKSFLTANLAYLVATTGRKVLLIDGDLRRGHLHRYMGQPDAPGLSELLDGSMGFDSCVIRNLFGLPLDFMPTGKYPPNPAELFLKNGIGATLGRLSGNYDLVLVDLPPLLSVVDPILAMRNMSVNLLVLRAGKHTPQEIKYSITRLMQNGISITGFILNDMDRQSSLYGYGYRDYAYKKEGS